ncbi:MAG: hypothetical protein WBB28_19705 [Crinalium sp.]
MSLFLTGQFTQMLLASTSSCHNVGAGELVAITALMAGLLSFAATVALPAATFSAGAAFLNVGLPAVITKILASFAIGASITSITVPLQPFLDIAAVAAVVEGVKHILGCG